MWLSALEIRDVRNLREVVIAPAPRMNLLWGANGSGKTSILEAIHLLGMGRSFEANQASAYIRHGERRALVFGRVQEDGVEKRLGIEKETKGRTEIRVDGQKVESAAQLAEHLPIILFTPQSHSLVEGGPAERRAFLDWGLFHVEQQFLPAWRRFQRTLKQRNAALAAGESRVTQWDEGLVRTGEALSSMREHYVASISPFFQSALARLTPELPQFSLEYASGWPAESNLMDALQRSYERDKRDGFTHVGPHRAELRIKTAGRLASSVLSRGQEKLVIGALRIAQLEHLKANAGKEAVVLIDDLPAELDRVHRDRFLQTLAHLEVQVFMTATDPDLLDLKGLPIQMFHVEHGQVQAVV